MPELEVRPTKLLGADLLASESAVLGASLRVKHQPKKERTLIVIGGMVPNLGLRVAFVLVFVLPLLILTLVAHGGVAVRIAEGAPASARASRRRRAGGPGRAPRAALAVQPRVGAVLVERPRGLARAAGQ